MADTTLYAWKENAANPGGVTQPKKRLFGDATSPTVTGQAAAQASGVTSAQPAITPQQGDGAAPTAPANPFAAPNAGTGRKFSQLFDTDKRQENISQAQSTISDLLGGQKTPSLQSQLSRSEFDKSAAEQGRQVMEGSALAGRAATGQIVGDQLRLGDRILGAKRDTEAQLAANDQQFDVTKKQAGISALKELEGLASAEKGQEAQIASTEKLAFADLDVKLQGLAQDAMQFTSKQDFDKWAIGQNISEAERERLWKSVEGEKDRELSRGEGSLNRELQKYGIDQSTGLEMKKLTETIRQFDSKQDFDKWATEQGIGMEERKLIWQSNENDAMRKHQTGMQLSDQEHNVVMNKLQEDSTVRVNEALSILRKDEMRFGTDLEKELAEVKNSWENDRLDKQLNSAESIEKYRRDLEEMLTMEGYDRDDAQQAAALLAQAEQGKLDRASSESMHAAEMLLKNKELQEMTGLKREEIDLRKQEMVTQADQFLKDLNLRTTELNVLKGSKEFQETMDLMATMSMMPGYENNPILISKTNDAMSKLLVDKGLISEAEARMGKLATNFATFTSGTAFESWAKKEGYTDAEIKVIKDSYGVPATTAATGATDGTPADYNPRDVVGGGSDSSVGDRGLDLSPKRSVGDIKADVSDLYNTGDADKAKAFLDAADKKNAYSIAVWDVYKRIDPALEATMQSLYKHQSKDKGIDVENELNDLATIVALINGDGDNSVEAMGKDVAVKTFIRLYGKDRYNDVVSNLLTYKDGTYYNPKVMERMLKGKLEVVK